MCVVALALPATASADGRPLRWKPVPTGSDQQYRGLDAVTSASPGSAAARARCCARPTAAALEGRLAARQRRVLFRDVEAQALAARACSRSARATRRGSTRPATAAALEARVRQRRSGGVLRLHGLLRRRPRGLALSDPVGGKFRIAATYDSGHSWHVLPDDGMPAPSRMSSRSRPAARAWSPAARATPGSPAAAARRGCSTRATAASPGRSLRADPGGRGRRRVLARVPQPVAGRHGRRRLHRARQRRRRLRLHARRRRDLDRRRRPLRLPLRCRLGDVLARDADRGRADRLGHQLRRRPQLAAFDTADYDAVDCVPSPAGRAGRRAVAVLDR